MIAGRLQAIAPTTILQNANGGRLNVMTVRNLKAIQPHYGMTAAQRISLQRRNRFSDVGI